MKHAIITLAFVTLAAAASAQQGTSTHARTKIPASLARRAKISDDSARAVALREVPGGVIQEGELERENGRLVYSYDIRVDGKSGIEEVQVSAVTGKLVSHEHESPQAEARERKHDAARARPATGRPS